MVLPTSTRTVLRQAILDILYATHDIVVSTTTAAGDSTTSLTDSALSPATVAGEVFRGVYVYISTQAIAIDSTANIDEGGQFSATDTTLTVTSSTPFTVGDGIQFSATGTATGEICRVVTITNGTTIEIVREIQGTTATTHENADNIFVIGPAVGEISVISNVSFASSTSKVTLAPAMSARTVSGQGYELHYSLHPGKMNTAIANVLDTLTHPLFIPVTLVTDGDMRTTGTSDWTAAGTGGTPTLAKNTTNFRFGDQSLSITNDGSTTRGFAKSASINLPENTEVIVACDVFITAGDSAKISLIDVTNSDAEIETAASAVTGWVHLEFSVSTPADCEQIQIWLEAPATSNVVYFDHIIVWPTAQAEFDLPSTFEYGREVERIVSFPRGRGLSNTGDDLAYAIEGKPAEFWSHFTFDRDDSTTSSYRLRFGRSPVNKPLFLEGWVDYAAFSSDSDTTNASADIVTHLAAAALLDDMALAAEMDERPELAERLSVRAIEQRLEVSDVLKHTTPQPRGIVKGTLR